MARRELFPVSLSPPVSSSLLQHTKNTEMAICPLPVACLLLFGSAPPNQEPPAESMATVTYHYDRGLLSNLEVSTGHAFFTENAADELEISPFKLDTYQTLAESELKRLQNAPSILIDTKFREKREAPGRADSASALLLHAIGRLPQAAQERPSSACVQGGLHAQVHYRSR